MVWAATGGTVEASSWVQSWGGEEGEEGKLTCLLSYVND